MTAPAHTAQRRPGRPRNEEASKAITAAALRQVDALGFANLSMESVAGEAGVARATVYRRWRDKADLITAAIAGRSVPTDDPSSAEDPKADLVRFLADFDQRFSESFLEVIGALMAAREDPRAMARHRARVVEPCTSYARALLAESQRRGELAPDADLDVAVQFLAGAVFARRVSGIPGDPDWAARAVDQLWRGLTPQTSPPR